MNEVSFKINANGVEQIGFSWSPARNIGIKKILAGAFEILIDHRDITKEYTIHIATADFPLNRVANSSNNEMCFDTVTDNFNSDDIFPDFIFGNWGDVGLEDWDDFVYKIQKYNDYDYIKDNRLFWSGVQGNAIERQKYLGLCSQYPKYFHGINIFWSNNGDGTTTPSNSFTSWSDHCAYKYLLDIPGYSWGTRVKFIPYCNRPLFVSERNYWTWSCIEVLKQNLHISVASDFSDILDKYIWAENNQKSVFDNAKKLLSFCVNNFTFHNICNRAAQLIMKKMD